MPLFDHFNILAPCYDRVIRANQPERLLNLVDLPFEGVVLDAGGGTGRIAQFLNGACRRIYIVDLSMKMLLQAGAKSDLIRVCSESESLPFLTNTFDRIVMVDALHHVIDQRKTAAELWRVLKVGGRIVVEEPDVRHFSVKLLALAEKLALMRSRMIPPPGVAALFDFRGADVRIESEGHLSWVVVNKTELTS